jgi:hypothetical protein
MRCKLCGAAAAEFARERVLDRFNVRFFRCGACEFIQTEEPYWLGEAYSEAINDSDVGLVRRNLAMCEIVRTVIRCFFDRQSRFLGGGGGDGMLTRLMRDHGLRFSHYEIHCSNLFARGHDLEEPPSGQYELITAFEVFEHLVHPREEVEKMLAYSQSIMFTTELLPGADVRPRDWWYFGLEHGQHISFFCYRSLQVLAGGLGLNLYSNGRWIHLLTTKKISQLAFRLAVKRRLATLANCFFREGSLMPEDYQAVVDRQKPRDTRSADGLR